VIAQVFSDWNDRFSTEIRLGYLDVDNRQLSLGGTDFGEVQIWTQNDPDGDGNPSRATVYLGADDSRHANALAYENLSLKLKASYFWNNHSFMAGFERDELSIYNLFIQEAQGEYRFSSVENFRLGRPSRITYENAAPSNNPVDAAASFNYEINALYLQDEIYFNQQDLTVVAGVRYEWYTSKDKPRENPHFTERYGFSNSQNLDGKSLLQPRVSFDWGITSDLVLRGGFGIFSGGNPNVWISNNYSNDGITQVERQERSLDDEGNTDTLFTIPFTGAGRPIHDIPQSLFDAVANGTADSGINVLDPDFKIPFSYKLNLGTTYIFSVPRLGDDFVLNADLTYSEFENSAIIEELTHQVQTDANGRPLTAVDGRPIYGRIDSTSRTRTQDFMLTNVDNDDAQQTIFSINLSKEYESGFSWSFGYAYTDSREVSPMTSSVAFSNYANIAVSDPNNPGLANSNYLIPQRYTLRLQYEREFVPGYTTRITLFGSHNEGRPFSFVFDGIGSDFGDPLGFVDRHLLYVPTGPADPNVQFGPDFNQDDFFEFVDSTGLARGQIAGRNSQQSSSWTKFDLKIEQSFPLPRNLSGKAFLIIENLANFLNDEWGIQREIGFPRAVRAVDASYDDETHLYTFNNFLEIDEEGRSTGASLWNMRIGVKVNF